jgi:hypothetical protein
MLWMEEVDVGDDDKDSVRVGGHWCDEWKRLGVGDDEDNVGVGGCWCDE